MAQSDGLAALGVRCFVHDECYLGVLGSGLDVASTTDNCRAAVLIDLRNERDMAFEIDVEEESDLLVRETFFWPEETPLNRLGTRSSDRGQHPVLVTGMKRADFNRPAITEMFKD